jgi:hypothetical protein
VTDIKGNPFLYCVSLTRFEVAPGNPSYTEADGVLYDKHQKTLIAYPGAKEGAYAIPWGVERIGEKAFERSSGLTEVVIPDSVTDIGYSAFNGSSITGVTIPESIKNIARWTFGKCERLTTVIIPDSVTSIGDYAFTRCSNLIGATIPNSVTAFGNNVFYLSPAILAVQEGSYAEQYAKDNEIPYVVETK